MRRTIGLTCALALAACGGSGSVDLYGSPDASLAAGPDAAGIADASPWFIDAPDYPDAAVPDGSLCTSGTHEARLTRMPSDIIFILDNSGSMDREARWVQENMNEFSRQIAASDVDFHVVVLSSYPDNENGICIDPPLGSGGCPNRDTNPPVFQHVNQKIESSDGLSRLLGTYFSWSGSMRPDAAKHIVIVSDDNSSLGAFAFDLGLKMLDPSFSEYKFHGIFCFTDCSSAAEVGSTYRTLVSMTDGVSGDLCEQDFEPVFNKLATAVVEESKIPCDMEMPEPPEGKEIDPDQVSIDLVRSAGSAPEDLARVAGAGECAGGGWYYDNNATPSRIFLCPSTCSRIQTYTDATLTVNLGCLGNIEPID